MPSFICFVTIVIATTTTRGVYTTGLSSDSSGSRQAVTEYCESESFHARCRSNEVILMHSALYGRMRIGRCVKSDLGYLGCATDVRHLADKRCSGRRECSIRVPNTEFDVTQPCFHELKIYLEAGYKCVPVAVGGNDICHTDKPVFLRGRPGYLASIVTEETGCGTIMSPWRIDALPGQRINITLLDFSADITEPSDGGGGLNLQTGFTTRHVCVEYGVITEGSMTSDSGMRMAICKGSTRERHIYQSRGKSATIYFTRYRDGKTAGYFMLKYDIIGCPRGTPEQLSKHITSNNINSYHIPTECEMVDKQPEKADKPSVITMCSDESGINCTQSTSTLKKRNKDVVYISQGLSVAIIISITLVVSVVMLLLGFIFVKCNRWRQRSYGGTQLPVTYESERGACLYADPRSEPLYATQTYECKTFTAPNACEKCLSQVNINGYGHYWDYIKDGALTLAPDNIPVNDGAGSGLYVTHTPKPLTKEDSIKASEETGEKESHHQQQHPPPCRYICRNSRINEPNMTADHELYPTLDDTPAKRL